MNRRNFITETGVAVGVAALTIAGVARADEHASHHHHETNNSLVQAALECVSTANACIAHCISVLGDGDTSLKDCARSVLELQGICTTLQQYANYNSKHLKDVATLAGKICLECEKECRKHDKHESCLKCADACAKCSTECKKVLS